MVTSLLQERGTVRTVYCLLLLLNIKYNKSSNPQRIIRVMRSRRIRWADHVARVGEKRGAYGVLVGKTEGKNHLEDLVINLKSMLK